MKTATIDDQQRAQLPGAVPKEKFWVIQDSFGYRLQRIPPPDNGTRMRREEVLTAIRSSTDSDLVTACERWLAVTGTEEDN